MNRKANLLLLCLMVVVLGSGVFLLLRRGDSGPGEGTGPLNPDPVPAAGTTSTDSAPASRVTQDPAGVQREAVAAATNQVSDPEYTAALCGFTGRVVTAAKEPAPKRTVRIYRFDPAVIFHEGLAFLGETTMDPRVDVGEGRTGDDGRFTIEGAYPRSTYALVADVGGAVPTFQIIDRSPGAGELCDIGDVVLRNAATLTGTVVDAEGKPVEGALVRAVDLPGAVLAAIPVERIDPKGALLLRALPDSREGGKAVFEFPEWVQRRYEELPIPKATTDREGKFTVTGVDGGVNCVMVTKPNKSSWVKPAVPVKVGQQKDLGTIKLDEGELVQGRVVDENGKAVAAAEVLLAQTSSLGPVDFALRAPPSDGDGRFSCVGFKPGQVTAAARRSPKDPWTLGDPVSIGADVIVRLPAVASLTVRATGKDGRPVENVKLKVYPSKADIPWAIIGLLRPLDLKERLESVEAGVLKVRDLPHGSYRLVADAGGYATATALAEVNGDAQATIELVPHANLKVLVTDANGKPIRRAAVYYQVERRSRDNMPLHGGTTGDDGIATLQLPVNADEVALSADHPRYSKSNKTLKLPATDIRIVLEAPGALDGILTVKGQVPEIGKYWISVVRRSWDEPGGRAGLPDMGRLTPPDAEGKFKMSGLAPGRYWVSAEPSQAGVHSVGSFYSGLMSGRAWREPYTVTIVSGQTVTLAIDAERQAPVTGPSARITGTVMLNGRPAEGMLIQGWSKRSLSANVDAAGRFDLGQVEEGQITLQVFPAGGQRDWRNTLWSSSFKLEANKDKELRIDLQVGSLQGIVYGADGAPAAGAIVEGNLQNDPGSGSFTQSRFTATAGTDGRFEAQNVRIGAHTVRATARKARSAWVRTEVTAAGTGSVELRMQQAYSVSGRVDTGSFEPLPEDKKDQSWTGFSLVQREGVAGASPTRDSISVWFDKDGKFNSDEGVFPGTYVAQSHRADGIYESVETIAVGNQDVKDLVLHFRKVQAAEQPRPPRSTK